MCRGVNHCWSMFGAVAFTILAVALAPAAEDGKKAAEGGLLQPVPVHAEGYITGPVSDTPISGPVLSTNGTDYRAYPTTAYPAPAFAATAPVCAPAATTYNSIPSCTSCYPTLARISADGQFMVQNIYMRAVTEIRKEEAEVASPDGKSSKAPNSVIQVRYVAEMRETTLPLTFDVYKMDGAKLSGEESRQALKEERAVVFSDIARAAVIMSPLGRKFYRDDILVIAVRNEPPMIASAPVSSSRPVFTPVTPMSTPVQASANAFPNFTPNGAIPFNGSSFDSRTPRARPIAQPSASLPAMSPTAPPPIPATQLVPVHSPR